MQRIYSFFYFYFTGVFRRVLSGAYDRGGCLETENCEITRAKTVHWEIRGILGNPHVSTNEMKRNLSFLVKKYHKFVYLGSTVSYNYISFDEGLIIYHDCPTTNTLLFLFLISWDGPDGSQYRICEFKSDKNAPISTFSVNCIYTFIAVKRMHQGGWKICVFYGSFLVVWVLVGPRTQFIC